MSTVHNNSGKTGWIAWIARRWSVCRAWQWYLVPELIWEFEGYRDLLFEAHPLVRVDEGAAVSLLT
jgi:hypothetical protein